MADSDWFPVRLTWNKRQSGRNWSIADSGRIESGPGTSPMTLKQRTLASTGPITSDWTSISWLAVSWLLTSAVTSPPRHGGRNERNKRLWRMTPPNVSSRRIPESVAHWKVAITSPFLTEAEVKESRWKWSSVYEFNSSSVELKVIFDAGSINPAAGL